MSSIGSSHYHRLLAILYCTTLFSTFLPKSTNISLVFNPELELAILDSDICWYIDIVLEI